MKRQANLFWRLCPAGCEICRSFQREAVRNGFMEYKYVLYVTRYRHHYFKLNKFAFSAIFSHTTWLYQCEYFASRNSKIFNPQKLQHLDLNTLKTGDADLRFYITTVQDGWRKSAFLTRAFFFLFTIHLIMQYIEPVSEWSCWRMFIETWPHSELTFRHRASSI